MYFYSYGLCNSLNNQGRKADFRNVIIIMCQMWGENIGKNLVGFSDRSPWRSHYGRS